MSTESGWPEATGDERSTDSADRRQSRRLLTSRQVPLVLLAGDEPLGQAIIVRCVNISEGGMRLEGPAPLLRGGRAAVQLETNESRSERSTRALVGIEVVYSHMNFRGDYDAGVRFIKLRAEAVRQHFLDESGRLIDLDACASDEPDRG